MLGYAVRLVPRPSEPPPRHFGARAAGGILALLAVMSIGLAACSPAGPEPEPTAAPSSSPTATEDPATSEPSGSPTPSESPQSTGSTDSEQPTATPEDPGTTSDPDQEEWEPPDDPTSTGPTEAPDVAESRGGLGDTVTLDTGLAVSVTEISTTTLEAQTPGEIAGSAVVVDVQISNGSTEPQALDSAVVSLVVDEGELAVPTFSDPYAPLSGSLAADESARGTYLFLLEEPEGRDVTLRVQPVPGAPESVFTGRTP